MKNFKRIAWASLHIVLNGTLILPGFAFAEDFGAAFDKLYNAQKYDEAEVVAAHWMQAQPDQAQPAISLANCYFGKAYQDGVQVTTKPAQDGDLELTDPKTNKPVGSISESIGYDPAGAKRGIDLLEKTVKKFPQRLDVWFGLAYVHEHMDDFPAMLDVLTRACRYAGAHPTGLWTDNITRLKEPADRYVPETLQGYCDDFQKSGELDKMKALSEVMVRYFPGHSYGYDNIGNYYAQKENWAKAKGFFQKASDLAPKDSLEWMNLGLAYYNTGNKKKAGDCWREIVALNNDPDVVAQTKGYLKKLAP